MTVMVEKREKSYKRIKNRLLLKSEEMNT